jgi:hypothetical protein
VAKPLRPEFVERLERLGGAHRVDRKPRTKTAIVRRLANLTLSLFYLRTSPVLTTGVLNGFPLFECGFRANRPIIGISWLMVGSSATFARDIAS